MKRDRLRNCDYLMLQTFVNYIRRHKACYWQRQQQQEYAKFQDNVDDPVGFQITFFSDALKLEPSTYDL